MTCNSKCKQSSSESIPGHPYEMKYITCKCSSSADDLPGLTTGQVIGIVIGVIAILAIGGGVAAFFICKAKKAVPTIYHP